MEAAGYIAAVLIGVSLGLVGGGGSILTVPVLVYFFGLSPLAATSYSLFIVGVTSLTGALRQYPKGTVDTRAAILFATFSLVVVAVIRRWLMPNIPSQLFNAGRLVITRDAAMMLLFGGLMATASWLMLRGRSVKGNNTSLSSRPSMRQVLPVAGGVGVVTGLLGAGGGFLLIPALVLIMHMPMKKAVGTSLLVIAINSIGGFLAGWTAGSVDWYFLTVITLLAISGIFLGLMAGKRMDERSLASIFGWFVMAMGLYILLSELYSLFK